MANGKTGDHPVTDVIVHGLSAFTPSIDDQIRQLNGFGAWDNQNAAELLLYRQNDFRTALREGDEAEAASILDDVRSKLDDDLHRLESN